MKPGAWLSALGARERRTFGIGALVLLGGLVIRLAIAAWIQGSDLVDQEARQRGLLAREVALLERAPTLRTAFSAAADSLLAVAPELTGGETVEEATAHLAAYVRSETSESVINLSRIRPLPADSVGAGLRRVRLLVAGESDLEGILGLIWRLRSGRKLVHVDGLEVAVVETPVAVERPERLSFELRFSAFSLSDLDPGARTARPASRVSDQ